MKTYKVIVNNNRRYPIVKEYKATAKATYMSKPTSEEIAQGFGSMHYREVEVQHCRKLDSTLAKWFKDDNGRRWYLCQYPVGGNVVIPTSEKFSSSM